MHLYYHRSSGQPKEMFVPIDKPRDDEHWHTIFRRLADFTFKCQQQVCARFPDMGSTQLFVSLFDTVDAVPPSEIQRIVADLAGFFEVDNGTLLQQIRELWSAREAILAKMRTQSTRKISSLQLWEQVLQHTREHQLDLARRILACWLLCQSQSCTCERGFSMVEELRKKLGAGCSTVQLEQYLLTMLNGIPVLEMAGSEVVTQLAQARVDKGCRVETFNDRFYRVGRALRRSTRAVRSDVGTHGKRNYVSIKRVKQLRGKEQLRTLRHLPLNPDGSEAPSKLCFPEASSATEVPLILQPHSPLRAKASGARKRAKASRAQEAEEEEEEDQAGDEVMESPQSHDPEEE